MNKKIIAVLFGFGVVASSVFATPYVRQCAFNDQKCIAYNQSYKNCVTYAKSTGNQLLLQQCYAAYTNRQPMPNNVDAP